VKPKVILFDLGGVLINFVGVREVRKLLTNDPGPDETRRCWISSEALALFERGGCSAEVFAKHFMKEWGITLEPGKFLEVYRTWIEPPFSGVEDLLSDLRQRHILACLSNTSELHWHAMLDESGLRKFFDYHYASHLIGQMKPDPRIFNFAVQDLGCDPSEIVFFDDGEENVDGARRAGLTAYRTLGFSDLESRIEQLGLLSSGYRDRVNATTAISGRSALAKT